MKKNIYVLSLFLSVLFLMNCSTVIEKNVKDEQITTAKTQREIRIGMPSSSVVDVLGAPNMVATDDKHCEIWVYDKVSTQVSSSKSSSGIWLLIINFGKNSSLPASNQKTLTIIVKFDEVGKVRDFSYKTSSF